MHPFLVSRYIVAVLAHVTSLLGPFRTISGPRVGPLDYVPGRASTGGERPHDPKHDSQRDDDLIKYA